MAHVDNEAARLLLYYFRKGDTPGQAAHDMAVTLESIAPYTCSRVSRARKFALMFRAHFDADTNTPSDVEWWNRNMATLEKLAAENAPTPR